MASRKDAEAALKKEQTWLLKGLVDTERKRKTRYTSYVHHDYAVRVEAGVRRL